MEDADNKDVPILMIANTAIQNCERTRNSNERLLRAINNRNKRKKKKKKKKLKHKNMVSDNHVVCETRNPYINCSCEAFFFSIFFLG